ncbi:6-phosphogluconate dehydrogenase C-terminal domain-like protein [Cylindrobasidium torrendii FP15055 ss-10]|uniref:6-phosphogluconate dehydrogenase C-terminal domain-like protein n=1 Tax=Cylindrobasidium torrendii FP15055 ss-10 TaxID=1314674 RepID=A0A0D7BWD3_9AGAR|nr:6-phosphogluconate dehydrogenase C-terminal domain-like protein [Cylindrobasidium torrendii FP15055 ss-10]
MTENKQKVLIIGLGAVGVVSAYIAQASGKADVTVVARSNYDLVKERGIDIKSELLGNHDGWRPDRICKTVEEAAATDVPYAYVLVVTKCLPDVLPTSTLLAPLFKLAVQPTYVLVQNGLGIEVELYSTILKELGKPPDIISVAMFIVANQLSPNAFQSGSYARYVYGVYRPNDFTTVQNTPHEQRLLDDLEAIISAGGGTAEPVPEIQRRKFSKNVVNVTLAALQLFVRQPLTTVFRPPPSEGESYAPYYHPATHNLLEEHTVPLIRQIGEELVLLARALGFPDSKDGILASAPDDLVQLARDTYTPPSSFHIASTLVDLLKGQPMEIEVIWGSVVRLAKERGVQMPRVEMVYAIVLILQNQIMATRAM